MNKENDKKFDGIHCPTPSSDPVMGEPEDSFDMVNKYGTYNIQPTSQTENSFPHIAQGLPKKRKNGKKTKWNRKNQVDRYLAEINQTIDLKIIIEPYQKNV